MNKLDFMNEIGIIANRFATLFQDYTTCHDGYAGKTEDGKPIIIGQISVSIQDDKLATITADIGSCDSQHRIKISRYPSIDNDTDWRIEDK